jgi:hypothetical protein
LPDRSEKLNLLEKRSLHFSTGCFQSAAINYTFFRLQGGLVGIQDIPNSWLYSAEYTSLFSVRNFCAFHISINSIDIYMYVQVLSSQTISVGLQYGECRLAEEQTHVVICSTSLTKDFCNVGHYFRFRLKAPHFTS